MITIPVYRWKNRMKSTNNQKNLIRLKEEKNVYKSCFFLKNINL